MRRPSLLLFGLWFGVGLLSVHAEVPDHNAGYLGSALTRIKGSDYVFVEYVAINSPAAGAGIKKGDCIIAINDISTRWISLQEAKRAMEGKIGTMVKLNVRRDGVLEEPISIARRSFLDTYLSAATEGDPRAQFYMGHFYGYGPAWTRDLAKSVEWFRKAAEQNNAVSQAYLGYMYLGGWGVEKDPMAAADWFLKAANQGDPFGEREIGFCYLNGRGVAQSDRDAFAWFYSAAQQDDPPAEQYLGFLYRQGRGVDRDNQASFDWYYRSAQNNNAYGKWGLAYMYEKGLGVKQDSKEAFKWYQRAEASLPQNQNLKKAAALMGLKAFFETRDSSSLDLSSILAAYRWQILLLFVFFTLIYVAGGSALFFLGFRTPETAPGLLTAIGWIIFYLESQVIALLAVLVFEQSFTAGGLIVAMILFGAVPVVVSTCGSNRKRIWKASEVSWKTVLLYGVCSCLLIFAVMLGYYKVYALVAHAPLPSQPTNILISKAKQTSAWLAYIGIALVLPAAEEIIFRRYLFDALRRYFSGRIVVVLTAAAFSLIHFQWLYIVPLFGFGLVLGWVRLKTDSLRLPVFLHAINNGLALTFAV